MSILYKNIAKAFQARGGFFKLTAGKSFLLKKNQFKCHLLSTFIFFTGKNTGMGRCLKSHFSPSLIAIIYSTVL